jgi:hypothetical protein
MTTWQFWLGWLTFLVWMWSAEVRDGRRQAKLQELLVQLCDMESHLATLHDLPADIRRQLMRQEERAP